jgi:hypothetical protein
MGVSGRSLPGVAGLSRVRTQLVLGVLITISLAAQTAGPQCARQFIAEGVHFIQQDRLAEAAGRFREAMKADPNNADRSALPGSVA